MAKAYQVKQVLKAVERLTALNEDEEVPGDVER